MTLWVFLAQVLNADQSCRAAVARLIAHRVSQGLEPCSSETGAYCQARKRLPERFFAAVACLVGRNLDARVDRRWLWKGRRVCLFDGSTVSMPDTEENRREYPLAYNQVPGTSFAPARIGALISLSCGAILDLGVCRYAGKGQGEVSLLRQLWDVLRPGDVLLGDRLMSGWVGMHLLKRRGVDTVSRLSAHRHADFRKGTRLGKDDHLVVWKKPSSIRSVDRATYNALPDSITVREVRFRVEQPGFRTRSVAVREVSGRGLEAVRLHYDSRVYEGEYGENDVLGERGPGLNKAGEPGVSQSQPLTISPTGALPYRYRPRIDKAQIIALYGFAIFGLLLQFPRPSAQPSRNGSKSQ